MKKKEFIEKFAEAIERESEIKMEDEFRNYDEWSSIAYLSVIAFMDDEYDTQIEEAEFKKLRTVEDLYKACVKE
jgi:acyl carrier protein